MSQVFQHIARSLQAYHNCLKRNIDDSTVECLDKHESTIESLVDIYLPSGSGIDAGVKFDIESSKPEKLIFIFSYHHMQEGYYTKWTEHKLIITPSLANDFNMRITGENYNDVKDYLYETFQYSLSREVK